MIWITHIILFLYYIQFEITGDPRNLSDSQQCDLSTTLFFALNHICSKSNNFCPKSHHFCSKSNHFCFEYKVNCKSLFVSAFNKPATWSIKYWYWLNSAISKWLKWKVIELRVVQFWSEIILLISNRTRAWNHAYDFRPNCTPLGSITIIYPITKN